VLSPPRGSVIPPDPQAERGPGEHTHLTVDRTTGLVTRHALSAEGRRRLDTEAAALLRLADLPGVVELVSKQIDQTQTRLYEGPTLLAWKGSATRSQREAMALGLVSVVSAVHARQVVHQDLSADNVLVVDGAPMLIDFELARLAGHAHDGGTPGTAAPELRWLPDPRLHDLRADVFSLGVMLRWLLLDGPQGLSAEGHAHKIHSESVATAGSSTGTGLADWLDAMVSTRRAERPVQLEGLLAVLQGSPCAVPVPVSADWPAVVHEALEILEDEVGEATAEVLRTQLAALVPIHTADLPPLSSWLDWSRQLARAHFLRLRGGASVWEAAELERVSGCVDRCWEHPGTAADLAIRMNAPRLARTVLGSEASRVGEPVLLALHAAVCALLGDVPNASKVTAQALRDSRPLMMAPAQVYWRSLTRVLSSVGAFPDLIRFLTAIPAVERGRAVACIGLALEDELERLDAERHRLGRRARMLRPLVTLALETSVQQAAFVLAELCLLRVRARDVNEAVIDQLRFAAERLEATSTRAAGPILAAVAEHQAGDAKQLGEAVARAQAVSPSIPTLDLRADASSWAATALGRNTSKRPNLSPYGRSEGVVRAASTGWAMSFDEDDSEMVEPASVESTPAPTAPDHPFVVLSRDGLPQALGVLHTVLQEHPRDAGLWTQAMQVWLVRAETSPLACAQELEVLLDALVESGMPARGLLPWRMQAKLVVGDAAGALRSLAQAAEEGTPPWAAWLVASRSWAILGDPGRQAESLVLARRAGAPASAIEAHRA